MLLQISPPFPLPTVPPTTNLDAAHITRTATEGLGMQGHHGIGAFANSFQSWQKLH